MDMDRNIFIDAALAVHDLQTPHARLHTPEVGNLGGLQQAYSSA